MSTTGNPAMTAGDKSFSDAAVNESLKMAMACLGKALKPRILKLALLGITRIEVRPDVFMEAKNVKFKLSDEKTVKIFAYCVGDTPFALLDDSFFPGAPDCFSTLETAKVLMAEVMKDPIKFLEDLDQKINELLGKLVYASQQLKELFNTDDEATQTTEFNSTGKPFTYGELKAWLNGALSEEMAEMPVQVVAMSDDGIFTTIPMRSIVYGMNTGITLSPGSKFLK